MSNRLNRPASATKPTRSGLNTCRSAAKLPKLSDRLGCPIECTVEERDGRMSRRIGNDFDQPRPLLAKGEVKHLAEIT